MNKQNKHFADMLRLGKNPCRIFGYPEIVSAEDAAWCLEMLSISIIDAVLMTPECKSGLLIDQMDDKQTKKYYENRGAHE